MKTFPAEFLNVDLDIKSNLKEFDIGIQAGFERRSAEWVLEPEVVQTVADLGARIRLTVYSPLLIIHESATRKRAPSRATRRP
jgi:hypothetical protein